MSLCSGCHATPMSVFKEQFMAAICMQTKQVNKIR